MKSQNMLSWEGPIRIIQILALPQDTPRCSAVICCELRKVIRRVNFFSQNQLRKLACNEKSNAVCVY